jgi:hypothetical protein
MKIQGKSDEDTLLEVVKHMKPERNSIVDTFIQKGLIIENAMQSQALLTLKNEYCNHQKCLQCEVGLHVLKRK